MARKKVGRKKASKRKLRASRQKPRSKKSSVRKKKRTRRGKQQITNPLSVGSRRGLGSASGGQSGDLQALSRAEDVDSESVEELLEEGQTFEAEAVRGVENAKDPDQGEVRTRQFPEDDVPPEYLEDEKP